MSKNVDFNTIFPYVVSAPWLEKCNYEKLSKIGLDCNKDGGSNQLKADVSTAARISQINGSLLRGQAAEANDDSRLSTVE